MDVLGKVKDLSAGIEPVGITLDDPREVSDVLDFVYVRYNIPGPDRNIPEFYDQFEGCQCKDMESCSMSCPCLTRFGIAYDENRKLKSVDPYNAKMIPVLECNKRCKCNKTCGNRVVQNGISFKLEVFRTEHKGFGLRCLDDIEKDSFVCEYAGELLTQEFAKKRSKQLSKEDSNYILAVREFIQNREPRVTYVDPSYIGNVGRFINHSCSPNLYMVPVRVNNNIPHVSLFALRKIPAGEELTYDYSGQIMSPLEPEADSNFSLSYDDEDSNHKRCLCGSGFCRGYLPYDPSLMEN